MTACGTCHPACPRCGVAQRHAYVHAQDGDTGEEYPLAVKWCPVCAPCTPVRFVVEVAR